MYVHIKKYTYQQHVKIMIACIVAIIFEGHLDESCYVWRSFYLQYE